MVKIFTSHYTHASLEKITYRLMSKWWCSGRHLVNTATRDDGPAAVKPIHSRKYFSSLTGTKRGLNCWTQRTSRVTWPTWLTRLWKNWTSWPTWTTWTTRPPCNIWLRWAFRCMCKCTATCLQPTHDQFFHTWQVVPPAHPLCMPEEVVPHPPSTSFSWGWVGTENTKGTISLQTVFTDWCHGSAIVWGILLWPGLGGNLHSKDWLPWQFCKIHQIDQLAKFGTKCSSCGEWN